MIQDQVRDAAVRSDLTLPKQPALGKYFRSVNIALVNELKMVYGAMGIDIWEVIEAAKTKPFGLNAILSRA